MLIKFSDAYVEESKITAIFLDIDEMGFFIMAYDINGQLHYVLKNPYPKREEAEKMQLKFIEEFEKHTKTRFIPFADNRKENLYLNVKHIVNISDYLSSESRLYIWCENKVCYQSVEYQSEEIGNKEKYKFLNQVMEALEKLG